MNQNQNTENPDLNQTLGDILNGAVDENQNNTPNQEGQNQQSTEGSSDQTPPANQGNTDPNQNTENSTIRQMRDQLKQLKDSDAKHKALLERMAAANNMTIEELEAKIQADEDKKNATARGIPVEIEQRIREQEQRIRELEEQNRAQNFNVRANSLISKYGMNEQQFLDFAKDMMDKGFDIRKENMDLDLLYRANNFDTLMKSNVEKAKQDLLAEIERQKNNSNNLPGGAKPNVSNNQGQGDNKNVTKDDLNNFVDDVFKQFNNK